jgi:hypothetical protein
MILFRPVGLQELQLITDTNFRAFPPRLPDQPIFYPVLNFEYARQIAEGWNTRHNKPPCGFVTRFKIEDKFAKQFPVQIVGGREHQELWVPAEQLEEFNTHIIGKITVEAACYGTGFTDEINPQTNLPAALK